MADSRDEQVCPACGNLLSWGQDEIGVTYQCTAMDCLEFFDEDEITPPPSPCLSRPDRRDGR